MKTNLPIAKTLWANVQVVGQNKIKNENKLKIINTTSFANQKRPTGKWNQALNAKKIRNTCSICIDQVIAGGKGLARLAALLRGEEVRSQGNFQGNLVTEKILVLKSFFTW